VRLLDGQLVRQHVVGDATLRRHGGQASHRLSYGVRVTRIPEADDLWVVDPDLFVAARDGLVRELRAGGNHDEAARIKAMRKPSRDAWVVNRLAREDQAAVRSVIDVGTRLRTALEAGEADQLRTLSAQRAAAVEAALAAAQELVGRLTPSVAEAVRATLGAALADSEAAELVKDGRLTTGLVYAGLGVAPATPAGPTPLEKARSGKRNTTVEPATSGVTARGPASVTRLERPDAARVRAAEQALRAAEDEVTATQLARAEAQEQVDELAQALDEAKELLAEAQLEARKANRARDAAAAALDRLRRRGS
jgi:hypothetical protein